MENFNEWCNKKRVSEGLGKINLGQVYQHPEDIERQPQNTPSPGDLVIKNASSVFRNSPAKNGWIQPKSRRSLFNRRMPIYMIDNEPENGKYPAITFSGTTTTRQTIWFDPAQLVDVTNAYPEEERMGGKKVWLWIKPNENYKYRGVYDQWASEMTPQSTEKPPQMDEPQQLMAHHDRNRQFWKTQVNESTTYYSPSLG